MINLREIDSGNWRELTKLKVKDWQAPFVASNGDSMARAHYIEGNFPLGIYDGEVPVGFCMYSISPKAELWILRLMIAADYQSGGRGRRATELLITLLREKYGPKPIYISFDPMNEWAQKLYQSLGFVKDEREFEDEIIYRLDDPALPAESID